MQFAQIKMDKRSSSVQKSIHGDMPPWSLGGCMRMRKLGHGHSVMFYPPLEVGRNIRGVAAKTDSGTQVTTVDILC